MIEFIFTPIFHSIGKSWMEFRYKDPIKRQQILNSKFEGEYSNFIFFKILNITGGLFIVLLIIFFITFLYALIFK